MIPPYPALAKLGCAAAVAFAVLTAAPRPAHAEVSGGCTAAATETRADGSPGSTIDITKDSVWHVHRDSTLSGTGQAPTPQTEGAAYADVFGQDAFTIAQGKGNGQSGHGTLNLKDLQSWVRIIGVSGSSTSCHGSLEIIIDDASPFGTAAGAGGLGLGTLGLAGVAGIALRRIG